MKIKKILYYFLIAEIISFSIMIVIVSIFNPITTRKIDIMSPLTSHENYDSNDEISQSFKSSLDNIETMAIYFPEHCENITISISDDNKIIEKIEINQKINNQYIEFQTNKLKNILNKNLKINIKSNNNVILDVNNNYNINQYLTINKKRQKGSISMYYIGTMKDKNVSWYFIVGIVVALLLLLYIREELKYDKKD